MAVFGKSLRFSGLLEQSKNSLWSELHDWPQDKQLLSEADPGFFLGGGAPLRNDVTDGEVTKF